MTDMEMVTILITIINSNHSFLNGGPHIIKETTVSAKFMTLISMVSLRF
jgi:hypothetical protein